MTEQHKKILAELTSILEEIIDEGKITLTPETTAPQVQGWDSLSHVQILTAIEKKYNFRFTLQEIRRFANVGEMIECIIKKTGN